MISSNVIAGAKAGSKNPSQPNIAPDSVRSVDTAKLLYAMSEGPIKGLVNGLKSVYLDDTPLEDEQGNLNFPDVKVDVRLGTIDQDHIAGFPESSNDIAINVELRSDEPFIRSFTNPDLSAVRVRLLWPRLLRTKDNADVVGYRIDYAIDIATDGGQFEQVAAYTINDKTSSPYKRSHRIDLPSGSNWLLRVRRLTPNQNQPELISDQMYIEAVTEVIDAKLRYPHTALIGLQYNSDLFQNAAKFWADLYGREIQVPSNYDPETREYTGIWDGTFKIAYTNNPAWVWMDIVLNIRFGTGDRIKPSMINKWKLYQISQYCDVMLPDGKGGMEPRYTCNVYIQTAEDAYVVLAKIANIFHGFSYWNGQQMVVTAEMPADPAYTFTRANIIDGVIEYKGTALRDRHTAAVVSWTDPSQGYKTNYETVWDNTAISADRGVSDLDIAAWGSTSPGQSQRAGNWALISEQTETRIATFSVGMDGGIPMPGDLINLSDELLAGRVNGGRIAAATLTAITLDRDTPATAGAYLVVNLPSGKSEKRLVQDVVGRVVTVSAPFSELPQSQSVWALEYTDLALMTYQVLSVRRADVNRFELSSLIKNPSKFAAIDNGARIELPPISVIPPGIQQPPASITLSQNVIVEQTMAVTTMQIAWEAASGAVAYEIEWRKDSAEWIRLPRTGGLSADVKGIYTGQYLARVRAINSIGASSLWKNSVLTDIAGKTGSPPALASFTASSRVFGIYLSWAFANGSEDSLRTEIEYAPNASGTGAIKLGDYAYPINNQLMAGLAAGVEFWFRARVVDRSGNEGAWTEWVRGISSTDLTEYNTYFSEMISKTALAQDLQQQIDTIPILEAQLAEITGAPEWNDATPYLTGQLVKFEGGIYRATQNVPAGIEPTDEEYWEKIGDYASLGEAVAALTVQMADVESSIIEIDGKLDATTSRVDTMLAAYREDDGEGRLSDAIAGWKSKAAIKQESRVRATENYAMAQQVTTLTAVVADNSAVVQENAQVVSDLDGGLQAMWSIKLQVMQNGQYYAAGMGIGIENTPEGMQSQVLFDVGRFGVINTVNGIIATPFVIQGGQTFISQAMIGDGWINNAMIGNIIQSNNYAAGLSGWRLNKNGDLEANNATFRGQLIGATGSFSGTIRAEQIIGDVYNIKRITNIPESNQWWSQSFSGVPAAKRKVLTFNIAASPLPRQATFENLVIGFGTINQSGTINAIGTVYAQLPNGTIVATWTISNTKTYAGYLKNYGFGNVIILDNIPIPGGGTAIEFWISIDSVTISSGGHFDYTLRGGVSAASSVLENYRLVQIQTVNSGASAGVSITGA